MKTFQEFLFEEEKASKAVAKYQNEPKGSEKCSNCNMWREPNGCTSVKGKISPDGWCKWYARNRKNQK
jgi:hypothetical protein